MGDGRLRLKTLRYKALRGRSDHGVPMEVIP